ncbi:MAG: cytochrome c [Thermoanaerobaculia bacterium]
MSTDLALLRPRSGSWAAAALLVVASAFATGCRQDMHDAPRYDPYEKSPLFANGTSAREPVPGTVARGHLHEDAAFYTGKGADGQWLTTVPAKLKVDEKLLRRGQDRFNIFCSPCHSRVGDGNGMIVRRGYKQAGNFHSDRLRSSQIGYFFDVMTNGFGQMPSYAAQVRAEDRWAIAAYIRVLQFSQHAKLAELPSELRQEAANAAAAEPEPGPHAGAGWGGFGEQQPVAKETHHE